jgi:hypothetical protein
VTMNAVHYRKIFLTFDVEDFVNESSMKALRFILETLNRHELHGLFFVTGHMAEKLAGYKETLDLFSDQQIGFHSSSHSVRPTILEYTDVEDYGEARLESERRENSHINPLTGVIEGKGGINSLRELFPDHRIEAFRAPDYCWSPPHLQTLTGLGIKCDFSTKLFPEPAAFKGITFYPFPICHNWNRRSVYVALMRALFSKQTIVLNFHNCYFVNAEHWNRYYRIGNPEKLAMASPRTREETMRMLWTFELFISKIKDLEKMNLCEVTPRLEELSTHPPIDRVNVARLCSEMVSWFKRNHGYEPKYLCRHFETFFFES